MLEELLRQIEEAIKSKLYLLALFGALAIPDICGALESSDGQATGQKYRDWFDHNLEPEYGDYFTGEDCYRFRCAMLHQGTTQHRDARYSRVLFIEPVQPRPLYHGNIMNDAFNIDVEIFCRDIVRKARAWHTNVVKLPAYQKNYDLFIKRYPDGLPPFITGVPVIS